MHLLFISSLLPEEAPASGFEIANRSIAAAFRAAGVRLSFAGFRRPGSRLPRPGEVPLGELAIENAGASRTEKAAWVLRALRARLPISAAKLAVLDETQLRERLAAAGPVDGFILNSVQMPTAYPFLVKDKPSIFIAHNVEHRSAAENARNARSFGSRLLYRREARLLKRSEDRLCRDATVVHTLSGEDAVALGLGGDRKVHPLALSIDRPAYADPGVRLHDIGLIGTWSWEPNRVGLAWFVTEVVPLLPDDFRIAIAGRFDGRPPLAPPNVSFLGRVPDAQAFVHTSRVIALATKGGTGVQLKTLETFEEGMPAVATASAMRGVGHTPDNVIVADDPADFAEALTAMVLVERAGRSLRRNGLAFALEQKHALTQSVRSALAAFRSEIAGGTRPAREPHAPQAAAPTALQPSWAGRP